VGIVGSIAKSYISPLLGLVAGLILTAFWSIVGVDVSVEIIQGVDVRVTTCIPGSGTAAAVEVLALLTLHAVIPSIIKIARKIDK
jgi:hypothetical protein